jgi:hypothetical protein
MARTTGPLMSLDASGSVANTIVFSRWKGRSYVRQLVTPSNPRSDLQVSTRAMMRFLSQAWGLDVDPAEQATWAALATSDAISNFNAYTRENLRRWTQFTAPGQANPVGATGTVPTFTTAPDATGGVRQATITWDVNALNDGWGLLIFRSLTNAFTPARDNLIGVGTFGTDPGTFIDTPLEPDTYYYNFRSFTDDGKMSTAIGQKTATVT